jgi:undecaprenyl-diphosphatase
MDHWNTALFLLLNASDPPNPIARMLATLFADYVIFLVPLMLVAGWLRGDASRRKLMLEATACGLFALLINQAIGLVWQHPRPFMIGVGHTLIPHVADSSFPSDHLTLLLAVAFTFVIRARWLICGVILLVLALPVAWARIYLGVHFPLDMAGAAVIAAASAAMCFVLRNIQPVFQHAEPLYRWLFAPLIRRGWVVR